MLLFQIIARASQLGEDPLKLSDRFCKEFHADMEALQCLPATVEPRVTSHMASIIKLIEQVWLRFCLGIFVILGW